MADIRNDFVGIKSPNPFWLASAPPTDKEYNVRARVQGRLGRCGLENPGHGRTRPSSTSSARAMARRPTTAIAGSSDSTTSN